ncbi:MAG: MarR family winged helix-turn-helix transcriptional regulator [Candidatus Dormibacteria bacterium]
MRAASEEVPSDPAEPREPDLLGRCLLLTGQLASDLVRALPSRSESPLRDLSLEQVDGILQIPEEGQAEGDFIANRGLQAGAGKVLVGSLLRRRLLARGEDGARLCLTDRGRAARDRLNNLRRGLLERILGSLSPERAGLLTEVLRTEQGGSQVGVLAVVEEEAGNQPDGGGVVDEILNRLLDLRRGLASWFGLRDEGDTGFQDVTLHQREALLRMPAEGATMREFARSLGISQGSATALADRLVSRELVVRDTDAADRRIVRLVPTALGQELAGRFRDAEQDAIVRLLRGLDPKQLEALAQVADFLTASEVRPTPPGAHLSEGRSPQ